MPEFVPYEKMSKKQRRAVDKLRRRDWNGVCPVTRVAEPDKKHYSRKVKHKGSRGEEPLLPSLCPMLKLSVYLS
ncbi:MAG: hypothetical protein IK130_04520 [Oscillospiraceae bacterium]|nr:hypothetical protein [Oscillospiraceae bacterium]